MVWLLATIVAKPGDRDCLTLVVTDLPVVWIGPGAVGERIELEDITARGIVGVEADGLLSHVDVIRVIETVSGVRLVVVGKATWQQVVRQTLLPLISAIPRTPGLLEMACRKTWEQP